ncbi:hypothetical protein ACWGJP_01620 [Microbacterium sp. NPDC055903]
MTAPHPVLTTLGLADRHSAALLAMLVSIDLVLIACYVAQSLFGFPGGFVFDLGADRGYGEFLQYAKWLWSALLLAALAVSARMPVAWAWMAACLYLLFDDAFLLHERAGWAFRDMVPGGPGWAVHTGEILFIGLIGVLIVIGVTLTHRRTDAALRGISWVMAALMAGIALFGVVIDAIHHLLFPGPGLRSFFTTIEDGGELLVLSLVVAFLFAAATGGHRPEPVAPRTRGRASTPTA